ncbi:MAG: hypothetical protein K0S65_3261, partial [Labilithrix sp.]|nr:hypothetical protein [Labilithrix sp.]
MFVGSLTWWLTAFDDRAGVTIRDSVVEKLHVLRPRGRHDLVRVLVCSLVGGFAGWVAIPGRPMPIAEAVVIPEVTLDGKPLAIVEGDAAKTLEAAQAIARAYVS